MTHDGARGTDAEAAGGTFTAPTSPGAAASRRETLVSVAALALLALALYARGFTLGLVGDDDTLLDAALRVPLAELLTGRHGILGYYRPVSRELYFWIWGHLFGPSALGYHVVNAITFAGVVAMLFLFVRRWLGARTGQLAALALLLFPPCGALLSWVSCAQDLIALFWCAASLLLYQSRRYVLAGLAVALAALSKETAAVMPLVLVAYEWAAGEGPAPNAGVAARTDAQTGGTRPRARWARLVPVFAGFGVALVIAIAMRLTWAPGTSVAVWSLRQLTGAWRLPLDFASTFYPAGATAGIAVAMRSAAAILALAAIAAIVAVPDAPRRGADGADARTIRRAIAFALVLVVLGMLPVGVIVARWRGYFFSLAALGSSVLLALLFVRIGSWPARVLAAALAIVQFGSNSVYQPIPADWGPGRHAHVNFAFFEDTSKLASGVLAGLLPWAPSIASLPRTFVVGSERNALLENVTGPALRVATRDTVARIRFLDAFTAADASSDFGVLEVDPASLQFEWRRADAEARLRLGEDFAAGSRADLALACFAAAASERPDDPLLAYVRASALAASGRAAESHAAWAAATAHGSAPSPSALALHDGASAAPAALEPGPARLFAAVLADPADAAAHAALGRDLLGRGAVRPGTFELAIACGAAGRADDLAALGDAYARRGELADARGAYRRALTGAIDPALRDDVQRRLAEVESAIAHGPGGTP